MIMKKKINIQEVDFEVYLDNALKSVDIYSQKQMNKYLYFEKDMDQIPIPECLNSPDFVFKSQRRIIKEKI